MAGSRSQVASDLVSAWRETQPREWSRALDLAEAQALLEHIDALEATSEHLNMLVAEIGKLHSRSLNRQEALTGLLYGVGYTARPYDWHGIIPTKRDPFVCSATRSVTRTAARPAAGSKRRRSRKRTAR